MISRLKSSVSNSGKKNESSSSTYLLFENHWKQANDVMESPEVSEGVLTVISHMDKLISLLKLAKVDNSEKSCKTFWLENKCSDKFIIWLQYVQNTAGIKLDFNEEKKLVSMLYALCEIASKDAELLGYKENGTTEVSWGGTCSLASLLLEFTLRNDDTSISNVAQSSFLLLLQLGKRYTDLENSLTNQEVSGQGITNIIISGISAQFSLLPTFTKANPDQLNAFMLHLKFVDKVTHQAPSSLSFLIADGFTNAFLSTIILPLLTQSLFEEIATVTYYLQIICETVSHPLLIRSLIKFINSNLLTLFIQRINHAQISVTVSTLSLINVLLDLFAEDLHYELYLKYLLPEKHLMISHRNLRLPDIDFQEATTRFFQLIPSTIFENLGEELSTEYCVYLNNESERWSNLVSIINNTPALSKGVHKDVKNSIYPQWVLSYDGVFVDSIDDLEENVEKRDETKASITNGTKEKDLESTNDKSTSDEDRETPKFITINLIPGTELQSSSTALNGEDNNDQQQSMNNLSLVENTSTHSTKSTAEDFTKNILETESPSSSSFGPFLDCLFQHLSNWTTLNPDVILITTQCISTLASSRIPLISSLFLDPSLILQPSYQSFASLLNRIRTDLEQQIQNVPRSLIHEVWQSMCKEVEVTSTRKALSLFSPSMSTSASFDAFSSMLFPGNETSLDNIRKSMTGAFNSVFGKRKSNITPSTSFSTPPQSAESSLNEGSVQSVGNNKGYRYVTPTQGQAQVDTMKLMTMKSIYFSHWLLELSAISQQLSFKHPTKA